ncbi:hypothetical protein BW730_16070 [Tessaracoccus aquimaris]|uniref:Glycosyl transferase family 1 domain-containing protein n=1 Tax=Tessaracoccus aquimaris TaxID=1332264 RepID=A0A1Q2CRU6_9ACTN|nr:glycosyltransferase [Tessaracoccus aquimaris]AQP48795.1 hypothetical protein BW730_16070 [Tessaracoccus aquimaris]
MWITSGFPYGKGEQFIESEIGHWAGADADVVLLPENAAGVTARRSVPADVAVSDDLVRVWHSRHSQAWFTMRAAVSPVFWRELTYLTRTRALSPYRVKHALLSVTRVLTELRALRKLADRGDGPIDLVYTYWMSVGTFAACLAKREGTVRRVVSRAHRIELYEEERPAQYTALVRQFVKDIDTLYTISDNGRSYAEDHYGFSADQLVVSRLGVAVDAPPTPPAGPDALSVMSVSSLIPVKQVERLAEALGLVAERLPDVQIRWRHAGDGPLRPEIQAAAERLSAAHPNLDVEFLGQVGNADLMARYAVEEVDVFCNVSASEGVPVSIMEAMARGIPAVAPPVGGTAELVLPELLLDANWAVPDLAEVLIRQRMAFKSAEMRQRAAGAVASAYDAASNYRRFVGSVLGEGTVR